eukprot:TRINITY_DN2366_c0_g1_i3.p1 TRINITY_DN2366_c0_g1~~TRINITY_DN2366_c0_g1_i3.p1  ORF type:complete len:558 (-),score=98.79 TRINITY_DN2366_c0_g1_i3:716-2389(-)
MKDKGHSGGPLSEELLSYSQNTFSDSDYMSQSSNENSSQEQALSQSLFDEPDSQDDQSEQVQISSSYKRNRTSISEIHMGQLEKRGSRSNGRGNRNTVLESQDLYKTGNGSTGSFYDTGCSTQRDDLEDDNTESINLLKSVPSPIENSQSLNADRLNQNFCYESQDSVNLLAEADEYNITWSQEEMNDCEFQNEDEFIDRSDSCDASYADVENNPSHNFLHDYPESMDFEDWVDDDFDEDLVSSENFLFEEELESDYPQLARYQYVEESPEGDWQIDEEDADQNRRSLSQGADSFTEQYDPDESLSSCDRGVKSQPTRMPSYYERNHPSDNDDGYSDDTVITSSLDLLPSTMGELPGTAGQNDDDKADGTKEAKDGQEALDEGIAAVVAIHDEVIANVERYINEDSELFGNESWLEEEMRQLVKGHLECTTSKLQNLVALQDEKQKIIDRYFSIFWEFEDIISKEINKIIRVTKRFKGTRAKLCKKTRLNAATTKVVYNTTDEYSTSNDEEQRIWPSTKYLPERQRSKKFVSAKRRRRKRNGCRVTKFPRRYYQNEE